MLTNTTEIETARLPRGAALAFQQRSEESSGGVSIASRLHEDVDHVAVLVHGAPEILSPALNGDEDLVEMPYIVHPAPGPGAASWPRQGVGRSNWS